jgi:hypothetical protein
MEYENKLYRSLRISLAESFVSQKNIINNTKLTLDFEKKKFIRKQTIIEEKTKYLHFITNIFTHFQDFKH